MANGLRITSGATIGFKRLTDPDLGRAESSHQTHIGLFEGVLQGWEIERNRVGCLVTEGHTLQEVTAPVGPITNPNGTVRSPRLNHGESDATGPADDGVARPFARPEILRRSPEGVDAYLIFAELDDGRILLMHFLEGGAWAREFESELGSLPRRGRFEPNTDQGSRIRNLVHRLLRTGSITETETEEPTVTERGSRQGAGYEPDAVIRQVIEVRAEDVAEEHYRSLGYEVNRVGGTESYDLHCVRGSEVVHVEVKGTRGDGSVVELTGNEVAHAQREDRDYGLHLVVVTGIEVEETDDGVRAHGGTGHIIAPWVLEDERLTPLRYRYDVPMDRWRSI